MMEAAVADDAGHGSIMIDPSPETRDAAKDNLYAFSDEVREKTRLKLSEGNMPSARADWMPVTNVPRTKKCFGWMQFTGRQLYDRLPGTLRPPYIKIEKVQRQIKDDSLYTALRVYRGRR